MINESVNNVTATSSMGGLQIIRATGDYFCAQCLLGLGCVEEYKKHYKGDLHAYNLKRRMLDLIPATPEQFEMKKKCKWSEQDRREGVSDSASPKRSSTSRRRRLSLKSPRNQVDCIKQSQLSHSPRASTSANLASKNEAAALAHTCFEHPQ